MFRSARRQIPHWLQSPVLSNEATRSRTTRRRTSAVRTEVLEIRQLLTGEFDWVQTLSGTSSSRAADVATDNAGNILTVGQFLGTVDFDPGTGTTNLAAVSQNGGDLFVTRSDSTGNLVWARSIAANSTGNSVFATSVALDSAGNIIVVGYFTGTADFDPGAGTSARTSAGSLDIFVLKLSGAGGLQWVRTFGALNSDLATSVSIDSNDAVYVGGRYSSTVDFDPGTGNTATTASDGSAGFVLRLTPSGGFGWVIGGLEANNSETVDGLTVRGDRVYAVASTDTQGGAENLTVAAINRLTGELVYSRKFSATVSLEIGGVAASADGSVVIAGNLSPHYTNGELPPSSMIFDSFTVTAPLNMASVFLVRLDANGSTSWVKSMPALFPSVQSIEMSSDGDIYVGGVVRNSLDADPGPGVVSLGAGTTDVFVAAYSSQGDILWARSTTSDSSGGGEFCGGLAFLPNGSVLVAGAFAGTTNFDPDGSIQRTVLAGHQGFLWALSPDMRFTFGAGITGDVLIRRNGANAELWFKGTFTFGQYVLMKNGLLNGIRSIRIADNSNANSVTVDYQTGGGFRIDEGVHFGSVSDNDMINVIGIGNEGITFAPGATTALTGQFQAYGGEISFAPIPALNVSNFQHLSVETQGSADVVSVSPVPGQTKSLIAGTTGSLAISPLTFDRVRDLTVNTGIHDGLLAQSNDSVIFNADSYEAQGLKNVFIRTGRGSDVLTVTGPNIALPVDDGAFWFVGGPGSDRLTAVGDTNWDLSDVRLVSGGGGRVLLNDVELASLTGGAGKNHLNASLFTGDVTLDGGANNDLLRGGSGQDLIFGGIGSDRILGGAGDDVIHGQDNNDQIWGEAGDDTLWGSGGNDQMYGGDGNDWMSGDAGDDVLYGGEGDDVLRGGANNDRLFGESGNDTCFGDGGVDLYDLQGTNNAEDLQLVRLSATSAQFRRKPRGLTSILEQDMITMDAIDEFLISALDGDDLITIDNLFTQLGSVDGGNGIDTCTAPAAWTKVSS